MKLEGTPSDQLPDVLANGATDIGFAFISLSAREPDGRDAEYIEWHSLDHRPEQYRLPQLRNSLRLVSTPECRAKRLANEGKFAATDHVMTYLFTGPDGIAGFYKLGHALGEGGRMPLRLPSIGYITGALAGKAAAPGAVAGADVIPWRATKGVYLLIEDGLSAADTLTDIDGVAGAWWYHGGQAPEPFEGDHGGRQVTYLYLDADPVETAERLRPLLEKRWESGAVKPLFAAPFFAVLPFAWDRYLPG
ncbi:MAG TPA: hypothetical protein VF503_09425 [Sphingobium sp.]|uniref:hypothetical protein n=1 Tax=Sphingobium sp. TaxID=1912891 RepID=UPI002ED64B0F